MGAWGINTFENDKALDWLGDFLVDPSEKRIMVTFALGPCESGFFARLLGGKRQNQESVFDGEEILAAAEVVATILGRLSNSNPEELKTAPDVSLNSETPTKAIAAIDSILRNSNLKDCWEETDDYEAWQATVEDIRKRLERK